MADRATTLINTFRSIRMEGQESEEKIDTLVELEDIAGPEVSAFLTEVAGDAAEYDLARIEAIKILQLRNFDGDPSREAVARMLQHILATDHDDDVRAYAATALSAFTDIDGVLTTAGDLVLDPEEDENVRHNAFFAVERSAPSAQGRELLTRSLNDPEFSDGARRVLRTSYGVES